MFFSFLIFSFSEIFTELIQKDLYVRGDGTITAEILQLKGDYSTIENVIIEDGPSIVDGAFGDMGSLRTITVSRTIELFQNNCFFRNFMLQKFIVSDENTHMWTDGTYLYQNNNKTLVGTIRNPTHILILPTVEVLSPHCFANVIYPQEMILPKSIKTLSYQTFVECHISSLKFESNSSLKMIPEKSIQWCTITKFTIPPSVEEIQYRSFYKCTSPNLYFEDVESSLLTTLGRESLSYCSCRNIILPSGVTEIPNLCFSGSSLVSIKISANCAKISETAFGGCTSLSSITVDPSNKAFKDVNGSLYSSDGKQLIFAPPALESFSIPKELESISQSVVQGLKLVHQITIEEGNRNFSTFDGCLYDFDGLTLQGVCGGVKQLNVSENATSVASQACKGVSITSVRFLGEKCASLGAEAFYGCRLLKEFCVPRGLKTIGSECFVGSSLESLTYEANSSLETISIRSFRWLGLRTIKLPKSLRTIGHEAFQYVYNVEAFELEEGSSLVSISTSGFESLKCTKENTIVLPTTFKSMNTYAFKGSNLIVSFANKPLIKTIPKEAFSDNVHYEGTFVILASIEEIQHSAFRNCVNVERFEIENGSNLTTISNSAFKGCTNLRYLELPASIESFDCSSISQCYNLIEFTVKAENAFMCAEGNILYNKNQSELIVCSPGEANAYLSSKVQSIRSNGFYQCSKLQNAIFSSPSKLETISKNTFAECTNLRSISMPVSMRFLLDGAFKDCYRLYTVHFDPGSKLEQIASNVFQNCHNLKTVSFNGDRLIEIGNSAFENCYLLENIVIPKSVRELQKNCFKSSGIKSVDLESVTELGENCFQNCTSLTYAKIENLSNIPDYAFEGCEKLERVSLPSTVEVLGQFSFSNSGLKNVSIPPNVSRIMKGCFMNSKSLSNINISSRNLQEIQTNSFVGCDQLKFVVYCGIRVITGKSVFPSTTIAYVNVNYKGTEFCNLVPHLQLTSECVFVDPTPAPTEVFTAPSGTVPLIGYSIVSSVIDPFPDEHGDSDGNE